jgi:hypothetical protein
MSLFDWLLVSHLVGDFLLQTDSMARYKATDWVWMSKHVGCYMAAVTAGALLYAWRHPLPLWPAVVGWVVIAATHIVLDRRGFTVWWMAVARISPEHPWLSIVVDQVFHILVLAFAAEFLFLVSGS